MVVSSMLRSIRQTLRHIGSLVRGYRADLTHKPHEMERPRARQCSFRIRLEHSSGYSELRERDLELRSLTAADLNFVQPCSLVRSRRGDDVVRIPSMIRIESQRE